MSIAHVDSGGVLDSISSKGLEGGNNLVEISLQNQRFLAREKLEMLTATGLNILVGHDAQDGMCKDLPDGLDRHRNAYVYANQVLKTPSSIIAWMEGKNLVAYAAICSPAEDLMDPTVQTTKEIMSIKYFEVVPDKRRQGFGKAIINDLLERAETKLRCISLKIYQRLLWRRFNIFKIIRYATILWRFTLL